LKVCNAARSRWGFIQQPACSPDEACVNLYRLEDPNSVVGVCMNQCNLFSATEASCADQGGAKVSCIPVPATGDQPLTLDGQGLCIPQQAAVASEGERCGETDPFQGAACASGLVCFGSGDAVPTCTRPCDLRESNAGCSGGQSCIRVTSDTTATLGLCR
jgi:hypothetical protein